MAEISIDEVTSGAIEGAGAFDEIMKAAQIRLNHEYEKDRIKGTEYSKVYLGTMESAMQQSIAYVLGRQQASAQADLLIEQKGLVAVEILNAIKQGELIDKQIIKMDSEIAILEKELIIMDSKIELAEQEILKSKQEVENLAAMLPQILAQTANIQQDTKLKVQQELNAQQEVLKSIQEVKVLEQKVLTAIEEVKLITAQVFKMQKDGELVTQQIFSEAAKTQDKLPAADGTFYELGGLLLAEKNKIIEEVAVLTSRKHTEQAKVSETTSAGSVAGLVGKQKLLYEAQIKAFDTDADLRQKKIDADFVTARMSVSDVVESDYDLDTPEVDPTD